MRMWNIDPKKMCRRHLLGEHVEMHMFVGVLNKNRSIKGYLEKNLVEVHNIRKRHDELVIEMKRRGYNHKSDLPEYNNTVSGKVNKVFNTQDLKSRCSECFSG